MLGCGDGRGAGTVDDESYFADVLAHHFQGVQQRGPGNNGGSVLVIVEDGNLHRLLQRLFDVKALGCFDVFEVDAAEGGLEQLTNFDDVVGIVAVDLDIEDIHISEALKEDGLPLHDRLASEGAY